ncbi:hypothetical protein ACLOJK_021419 [Asimina triloba]
MEYGEQLLQGSINKVQDHKEYDVISSGNAQLVERRTVVVAEILRSLVRIRQTDSSKNGYGYHTPFPANQALESPLQYPPEEFPAKPNRRLSDDEGLRLGLRRQPPLRSCQAHRKRNLPPTTLRKKRCFVHLSSWLFSVEHLIKKHWASEKLVDTYVRSGMVVGLGSGRASEMVIQYLGRQLRGGVLKDIIGIDFAVDDADIMEEGTLTAVIGRRKLEGGESILQEKSVMKAAGRLAFIITEKHYGRDLEGSIPVLVQQVWRRAAIGQAGPLGGDFPFVTGEGHNVLDVIFTSPILNLAQVAESLDKIDGVVDHGVISGILVDLSIGAKVCLEANLLQSFGIYKTQIVSCTAVISSKDGVQVVDNLPRSRIEGV